MSGKVLEAAAGSLGVEETLVLFLLTSLCTDQSGV